jgi:hypothetical protein
MESSTSLSQVTSNTHTWNVNLCEKSDVTCHDTRLLLKYTQKREFFLTFSWNFNFSRQFFEVEKWKQFWKFFSYFCAILSVRRCLSLNFAVKNYLKIAVLSVRRPGIGGMLWHLIMKILWHFRKLRVNGEAIFNRNAVEMSKYIFWVEII